MLQTSVAHPGRTVRRASLALAVLLAATTVAACGSSARTHTVTDTGAAGATSTSTSTTTTSGGGRSTPLAPGGTGPLSVAPSTGGPTSDITFGFRPRSVAYAGHQIAVTYGLTIHGPVRAGCIGEHAAGVPVTRVGPESVTVGPSQLGGHWCAGTYTARVEAVARPVCAPGTMCPQFIRIVASFGPATFRIRGG